MSEEVRREGRFENGRALTASQSIKDARRLAALDFLLGPVHARLITEKRNLERWNLGSILSTLFFKEKGRTSRLNEIQSTLSEIVSIIQMAAIVERSAAMAVPSGTLLSELSLKERGMLAYLLGPMNSDTRIVALNHSESPRAGRVTVVSRFPGNANMMIPVIRELMRGTPVAITAITDGKAKDSLEGEYKEKLVDVTPANEFYAVNHTEAVGGADVVFLDAASGDALSAFMATEFTEQKGRKRPKIVILHDAYTSTLRIYDELAKWQLLSPKLISKICVMDKWQKNKIIEKYPFLTSLIVITGQPLFDEMNDGEIKRKRIETRDSLGIQSNEVLLSLMLNASPREGETEAMGQALGKMSSDVRNRLVVTIRRHPRLNEKRYAEYVALFTSLGLRVVDSMQVETRYIRVASDIILNTLSTEGTAAVAYGIPAIHVVDPTFGPFEGNPVTDVPPADEGAAIKLEDTNALTRVVEDLMNPKSVTSVQLTNGMKRHPLRKQRGKSAASVARVVSTLL